MEIGEAAAVAIISDAKCPIAHKDRGEVKGKAKNEKSVAQLRSNMEKGKSTQQWVLAGDTYKNGENTAAKDPCPEYEVHVDGKAVPPILVGDDRYPLSLAAHHIVPGKASLPRSDLRKFIWKSEGKIKGDIGYDVDGAENGVWLPTHAKLSAGMGKRQTIQICDEDNPARTLSYAELGEKKPKKKIDGEWKEVEDAAGAPLAFIEHYTRAAMDLTRRQFHDSHSDYSNHVVKRLNKLHVKLCKITRDCPDCKKMLGEKLPPPYGLVHRLNAISGLLRGKLQGPPTSWTPPVFTSNYAKSYRVDARSYKKAMRLRSS
ncbi:MAG: AHH domain-containing protein [Planctomycetes bacterium]|nr:AHH domain-containing protein [Planctomycetota bacterium]